MGDFEISEIDIKQRPSSALPRSIKISPEVAATPFPKEKQSASAQEKWNGFVESSTLHGLQHVFGSRSLARRVIWALFLLLGIGWFSLQTQKLLTKYFSYPVTTKVTLVYEENPEFPAVSICNFNMFRRTAVKEAGFEEVLRFAIRLDKCAIFLILRSVVLCYVHAGDLLSQCYRTWECKDGNPILRVRQPGTDFALHLVLDVQQWDYGPLASRAGLLVLIHDHEIPPLTINLPDPYESKCLDKNDSKIPGYETYTILGCLLMCETKYLIEKCGCRDVGMPAINGARECDGLEISDCVLREKENFQKLKGAQCKCPLPCGATSFRPLLSYAAFPSDEYIKRSQELYADFGHNASEATLEFLQEYTRFVSLMNPGK
ncbi:acid-sensing ion channel 4-like [Stylophora pistillata]|uniref:acid-sensing ion channel 4-like n=1 Tax=Stylophora pistillata TaxID=50429 RepID=UPI000C054C5C|nr:acid-sensing ion channel 4-like [Stylophora pistillata]